MLLALLMLYHYYNYYNKYSGPIFISDTETVTIFKRLV